MNILLIGAGGREHALALAIAKSPLLTRLFVAPGNPGTETIACKAWVQPVTVTNCPGAASTPRLRSRSASSTRNSWSPSG